MLKIKQTNLHQFKIEIKIEIEIQN